MSEGGNFYELALRRRIEIDRLRYDLAIVEADRDLAEAEMLRLREVLVEADREIKALRDELDYAHQENDDLERQLDADPLSNPLMATCPVCGAEPTEPCSTPLQYPMPTPHTKR